jgi:hypothetical protein
MMLDSRLRAVPILAGLIGLVAFATPAAAKAPDSVAKAPDSAAKLPHSASNGPHDVKVPGVAVKAPRVCAGEPAAVFAPWHDNSLYLLAPDGDLEAGGTGWNLAGDARVVSGGDPFALGGSPSKRALSLPAGSSATSPATCIAKGMPTFRLTARNTGAAKARLLVTVVYGAGGKRVSKRAGEVTAGRAWSPIRQFSLKLGQVGTATSVSFRFTPLGRGGRWQIDSLYIDPRLSH